MTTKNQKFAAGQWVRITSADARFDGTFKNKKAMIKEVTDSELPYYVEFDTPYCGARATWFTEAELTAIGDPPASEPAAVDAGEIDYDNMPGSRGLVAACDAIILELDTFNAMREELTGLKRQLADVEKAADMAVERAERDHLLMHEAEVEAEGYKRQLAAVGERERVLVETMNPAPYVSLETVANLLDSASVAGWESRYAAALGFAIGYLRRQHALVITPGTPPHAPLPVNHEARLKLAGQKSTAESGGEVRWTD